MLHHEHFSALPFPPIFSSDVTLLNGILNKYVQYKLITQMYTLF